MAPPDSKHTYFVIGVAGDNVRVSIFDGNIRGGKFNQKIISAATFYGAPEDGYILGGSTSGKTLAVTVIGRIDGPDDHFAVGFVPCGDAKVMVFETPAGKTIYLGDIAIIPAASGYRLSFQTDLDQARRWIKTHYPKLMDELQLERYQTLPVSDAQPC